MSLKDWRMSDSNSGSTASANIDLRINLNKTGRFKFRYLTHFCSLFLLWSWKKNKILHAVFGSLFCLFLFHVFLVRSLFSILSFPHKVKQNANEVTVGSPKSSGKSIDELGNTIDELHKLIA